MKNLLMILILCTVFCTNDSYAQEYNYARLVVIYGSNIPFHFNSIDDYKNGIRIEDGTILGVTMVDSTTNLPTVQGFDLRFRSFNGQADISGSGSNSLPLSTLHLEAVDFAGLGAATFTGLQPLTTGWIDLVNYTDFASPPFNDLDYNTHQIKISYECGVNTSLLGESADYYNVEIELELIPTGPGF